MAGALIMLRSMLARRIVAAANVTAFGTAAQVQPPAACRQTLDAASPAGLGRWINAVNSIVHASRRFLVRRLLTYRRAPERASSAHCKADARNVVR